MRPFASKYARRRRGRRRLACCSGDGEPGGGTGRRAVHRFFEVSIRPKSARERTECDRRRRTGDSCPLIGLRCGKRHRFDFDQAGGVSRLGLAYLGGVRRAGTPGCCELGKAMRCHSLATAIAALGACRLHRPASSRQAAPAHARSAAERRRPRSGSAKRARPRSTATTEDMRRMALT